MNFSYKRLLLPALLIGLCAIALHYIQTRPTDDTRLTNEQLKANQQQWAVQNQQNVLSREEKLESVSK